MRKFAISCVLAGAALGLCACNNTTENKTVVETAVENETVNATVIVENETANTAEILVTGEQDNSADKSGPRERTTPTEK